MKENELRMGLLISGSGTTAEAVIKACQQERLPKVKPVAVISSRPDAPGIEKAKRLKIKTFVVQRKNFPMAEAFGDELLKILRELCVDFVSQNGWLPLTPTNLIKAYQGRIINQHPGPLDPDRSNDFGGKGMYGSRVVCARLAYVWTTDEENPWTESTIHHVTKEYDQGDLIRVVRMAIPSLGRPVTIAELREKPQQLIETTKLVQTKLLSLEHQNVIATLRAFVEGKHPGFTRTKSLISPGQRQVLFEAKKLAVKLFPKG